jgi:acyl carrier protein
MTDVKQALREFITENFLFGVETAFSDDDSFMDTGIIDSTGTLELIMHLEAAYDVTVEDDELVPENLDSIDNLSRFITAKQEKVSGTLSARSAEPAAFGGKGS